MQGSNDKCIKTLVAGDGSEGYLNFHDVLWCARNEELDPLLRSQYIDLILVIFVDSGGNRPYLDNLPYLFVSWL